MIDSDPVPLFTHLIKKLNEKKIGFLEVNEEEGYGSKHDERVHDGMIRETLAKSFKGIWIANGGMTFDKANDLIVGNNIISIIV